MYTRKFKGMKTFEVETREQVSQYITEARKWRCGILKHGDKAVLVDVTFVNNFERISLTFSEQGIKLMEDDNVALYMVENEIVDFFDMETSIGLSFKRCKNGYKAMFPKEVSYNGETYVGVVITERKQVVSDFLSHEGVTSAVYLKANGEEILSYLAQVELRQMLGVDIVIWK